MIFGLIARIVETVFPFARVPSPEGARYRSVELPPLDWIKGAADAEGVALPYRPPPEPPPEAKRDPAPWWWLNEDGLIVLDGPDMVPPWERDPDFALAPLPNPKSSP